MTPELLKENISNLINTKHSKCILGVPDQGLGVDFRGRFKLHVNYNEYIHFNFKGENFQHHLIHKVVGEPQK